MKEPISKACPRCKKDFQCNSENIEACQCSSIQMLPETSDWLKKTDFDCLCARCLGELNAMSTLKQQVPFPRRGEPLKGGIHYYMDNGLFVFTEFYHFSRGNCCKSGCRHCAYGYQKSL